MAKYDSGLYDSDDLAQAFTMGYNNCQERLVKGIVYRMSTRGVSIQGVTMQDVWDFLAEHAEQFKEFLERR